MPQGGSEGTDVAISPFTKHSLGTSSETTVSIRPSITPQGGNETTVAISSPHLFTKHLRQHPRSSVQASHCVYKLPQPTQQAQDMLAFQVSPNGSFCKGCHVHGQSRQPQAELPTWIVTFPPRQGCYVHGQPHLTPERAEGRLDIIILHHYMAHSKFCCKGIF